MKRATIVSAFVFAAIPVVMLTAAVACTWAIAHGASQAWRLPFLITCHGIPERCLVLWGVPMPICARCTAIYAGLFLGISSFFALPYFREQALRMAVLLALVPMGIDGLTQLARLRESTNEIRVATGIVAGFTFGLWVLTAIERKRETQLTTS